MGVTSILVTNVIRNLVKTILANIIFATFVSCKSSIEYDNKQPNILFILADDLGAFDLGYAGSKFYETPNLDRLAKKAFIFTSGYSASRVCSPSRASIMTGKFTARHGVTDWIGAASGEKWRELKRFDKLLPANYSHQLRHEEITIPEALKVNDYKTFFAGKWHLGSIGSYPENHGFDINVGGWEKGSPEGGYYSPWNNPKIENKNPGENLSMRLAMETADFIRNNKNSPFFAFLSFYAVHAPLQTSNEKWEKYRKKAIKNGLETNAFSMDEVLPIRMVQDNPIYAGLIESMDEAIGLVLKSLENLDLEENTIIIFTSDNGGVVSGDHFSTSNLPLKGGKGHQWEGGIKCPLLIYVPWLEGNHKKISYPVINTDFYPTILDMAGIDLIPNQHLDGISLKKVFSGGNLPIRSLFWHYPHYGNQGGQPSSIIQKDKWKMIHYWEDGHNELYNLNNDSFEKFDLASRHPEKTLALYDELSTWLVEVDSKFPIKDPDYDVNFNQARKKRIENNLLPKLENDRKKLFSKNFKPNPDWWGSKLTID